MCDGFIGEQSWGEQSSFQNDTVDGRNPAPVGMENLPLFTVFYLSQVVQDFVHKQYYTP